jgi:hypothetical protein
MIKRDYVFDTYWWLAAERQAMFFKKLHGQPPPYTNDAILSHYKFCNTYRASDRVSQFLIKGVIYGRQPVPAADTLFRIFLFRLFNKIATWQQLEQQLGEIRLATFSLDRYTRILESIHQQQPIYGNAFILCANKAFGFDHKHLNHLALLQKVFVDDGIVDQLLACSSLASLFDLLKSLPLIGDFMAYQLAIDMNYAEVFDFSENDFTMPGPGALRGIHKCFASLGGATAQSIIMQMVADQDQEFARLGLDFQNLGGRKLQAIDCQGLFCELDKYTRVKYPELTSNRSKIKAVYAPTAQPIDYFYPPKWDVQFG